MPYESGGRQATKHDILNLAWLLGMPLSEDECTSLLVARLEGRARFVRDTLAELAKNSIDPRTRQLAEIALGDVMSAPVLKESPQ